MIAAVQSALVALRGPFARPAVRCDCACCHAMRRREYWQSTSLSAAITLCVSLVAGFVYALGGSYL